MAIFCCLQYNRDFGSILIDWSSDLSGVQEGSSLGVNGLVMDSTEDSVRTRAKMGI